MKTLFALFCMLPLFLRAQTSISGIVNNYAHVRNLGSNYVATDSAALFSAGDHVLLIQMNGATMDITNTSTFGSVISYNNAGKYEYKDVASIIGNHVVFTSSIVDSYDTIYAVQLVKVPVYTSAVVTDTLTPRAWNGQVGGVLAIKVQHKLTLNAFIKAYACGFRGGWQDTNPDGSCGAGYTDYYYPLSVAHGGEKGEGITPEITGMETGMGPQTIGGGGGNKHNSGGGGGGNFTTGGKGGDQANFCPSTPVGGMGGRAIAYSSLVVPEAATRVFMGGGGGCSDYNNGVGTYGGAGGGIILITADTIEGNGDSITSNGQNVGYIYNTIGDGAGGGGAGGSIVLDVIHYGSTPLHISANGGNGGDQYTTYPACFGIGGGGGVGIIMVNSLPLPLNVDYATLPGDPGTDINPSSACYGTHYGASGGDTGTGIQTITGATTHTQQVMQAPHYIVTEAGNYLKIDCSAYYPGSQFAIINDVGQSSYNVATLQKSNTINIANLPAGIYNVLLNIQGKIYCERFVKY